MAQVAKAMDICGVDLPFSIRSKIGDYQLPDQQKATNRMVYLTHTYFDLASRSYKTVFATNYQEAQKLLNFAWQRDPRRTQQGGFYIDEGGNKLTKAEAAQICGLSIRLSPKAAGLMHSKNPSLQTLFNNAINQAKDLLEPQDQQKLAGKTFRLIQS